MDRGDDNLNQLINAVIEDSGVAIPQRTFILVTGLADDGEPILSERWINLDDLDRAIDEYTKCADLAFVPANSRRYRVQLPGDATNKTGMEECGQ